MAVIKTQNTQVFAVIKDKVVRFVCPQNFKFGQDSFGKIEVTCLDAESKQYVRGLRDPGEAGIGINYDDENTSHDDLIALAESGEVVTWYVGTNHSKDAPIYDALDEDDKVTLPETRAWFFFYFFMNDTAPSDIEVDSVIKYDFTIVRTSKVTTKKRKTTP